MDDVRIPPAGDPFTSAPAHPLEECFVCYDGLVFIGRLEQTEEGEEVEAFEPIPCRRCADSR